MAYDDPAYTKYGMHGTTTWKPPIGQRPAQRNPYTEGLNSFRAAVNPYPAGSKEAAAWGNGRRNSSSQY